MKRFCTSILLSFLFIACNLFAVVNTPNLILPANSAIGINPDSALCKWQKVDSANAYILQISKDSSFIIPSYNRTLSDTSALVNSLFLKTKFYWRVKAIKILDTSAWSAMLSFTTGQSYLKKTFNTWGRSTPTNNYIPTQYGLKNNWNIISSENIIAIKGDGTLWTSATQIGSDSNWQSVASSPTHSLAIKNDGTLWAWGDNSSGQLGDNTTIAKTSPVQIGALNTWQSISAGRNFTLALKTDGTLWAWGYNGQGQLGDGTTTSRYIPTKIGALNTWQSVYCGAYSAFGIKKDSSLWAWGYNNSGQLGDSTSTAKSSPVQIGAPNKWLSAAIANNHSLAIRSDGTLWGWGNNSNGQVGNYSTTNISYPVQISWANNWKQVAPGGEGQNYSDHSLALKEDGSIWGWGANYYGQIGNGNTYQSLYPTLIDSSKKWLYIVGGTYASYALAKSDGTFIVEKFYPINNQINVNADVPFRWSKLSATKYRFQLASDTSFANIIQDLFLSDTLFNLKLVSNTKYYWRVNAINNNDTCDWGATWSFKTKATNLTTPILIAPNDNSINLSQPLEFKWKKSTNATAYNLQIALDSLFLNTVQVLKISDTVCLLSNLNFNAKYYWNVRALTANDTSDWSLKRYFSTGFSSIKKTLWGWGLNTSDQLGASAADDTVKAPILNCMASNWQSVANGVTHTLAIKNDGTLWAWGANGWYQLGDGKQITRNVPIQIGSENNWQSVACGSYHSVAIKTDGSLWAWGSNYYGQLGDASFISYQSIPTRIGAEYTWRSVSCVQQTTFCN